MASGWGHTMGITVLFGRWMLTVRCLSIQFHPNLLNTSHLGDTKFLVSGAADNTMKLWEVSTGKCLYTWEFPTAVKRVAFSPDGSQIVCITEQRMGHQSCIRIFDVDREGDGTQRSSLALVYCAAQSELLNLRIPRTCDNVQPYRLEAHCLYLWCYTERHTYRPRIRKSRIIRRQDGGRNPHQPACTHGRRHGPPALARSHVLHYQQQRQDRSLT